MPNALYDKGRERFLNGQFSWTGIDDMTDPVPESVVTAVLVDTGTYTPDLANDEYLSDIPPVSRISTSPPLTGKTSAAGVADADDVTFSAVSGPTIEALVLYADTGDPDTSPLIAYISIAIGLPFQPAGVDVIVQWSDGPNRIFKL